MIARGPLAPLPEIWTRATIRLMVIVWALAIVVAFAVTAELAYALFLFGVYGSAPIVKRPTATEISARLAAYPFFAGYRGNFGALDLVLCSPHALAEPAVRLVEPEAICRWSSPSTLRVDVPWGHHLASDLRRLERLMELLANHRAELGLERIELVPPA